MKKILKSIIMRMMNNQEDMKTINLVLEILEYKVIEIMIQNWSNIEMINKKLIRDNTKLVIQNRSIRKMNQELINSKITNKIKLIIKIIQDLIN